MRISRFLVYLVAIVIIAAGFVNFNSTRVLADNAFTVEPAKIDYSDDLFVTPGETLNKTITFTSDPTASIMDMNVVVKGLGQTRQGVTTELEPQDDTPFSARTYISNVTPATFRIEPGEQVKINFAINVPADATEGEKYALLSIFSNPYGTGQGAAAIIAIDIPIILKVGSTKHNPAGQIVNLAVTGAITGKPLEIQTTLLNTGITRIKGESVFNRVVVKDITGNTVAQAEILLENPSLIPSFERTFIAHPGPATGLPAGEYIYESSIITGVATVIDTRTDKIIVTETPTTAFGVNLVLPGMDPDSLVVVDYDFEEDGANFYVDAIEKAGVEVELRGAAGFGAVIIGRYSGDPGTGVPFSAPVTQGGTGKTAIKYVDVRAPGLTQGTAHVTVHYTPEEVKDFTLDRLILAYYNGTKWIMPNLTRNIATGTISFDVQVLDLTGTVIGLGGDHTSDSSTNGNSTNNPFTDEDTTGISSISSGTNWGLVAGIIGGVAVFGIILIIIVRRNKSKNRRRTLPKRPVR
ncbi:MAG: hypothetical protein JW967_11045 [Dehalococcoidales bacterium]|nr:hypothetical protein [Dehalococcoidales bacterium]